MRRNKFPPAATKSDMLWQLTHSTYNVHTTTYNCACEYNTPCCRSRLGGLHGHSLGPRPCVPTQRNFGVGPMRPTQSLQGAQRATRELTSHTSRSARRSFNCLALRSILRHKKRSRGSDGVWNGSRVTRVPAAYCMAVCLPTSCADQGRISWAGLAFSSYPNIITVD